MNKDTFVNKKIGDKIGEIGFGIAILLAIPKIILGTITGSISLMADGVNNLMDSAASIITIVGMRFSKLPGDKDHPYGHARIEYITGFTISLLTALIGIEFFKKSFMALLSPEESELGYVSRIFLLLSIILKLGFASLNNRLFKKYGSTIFQANRQDATMDVITSATVLVSGYFFAKYPILDAIVAIIISLLILYSAYETLKDTVSPLIGERPTSKDIKIIEDALNKNKNISSYHSLYVDRKSMEYAFVTVDVEVRPEITVGDFHDSMEPITQELRLEHNIELVVHVEPCVLDEKREQIKTALLEINGVNGVYDLILGKQNYVTLEIKENRFYHKDKIMEEVDKKLKEMDGAEWKKDLIVAFEED